MVGNHTPTKVMTNTMTPNTNQIIVPKVNMASIHAILNHPTTPSPASPINMDFITPDREISPTRACASHSRGNSGEHKLDESVILHSTPVQLFPDRHIPKHEKPSPSPTNTNTTTTTHSKIKMNSTDACTQFESRAVAMPEMSSPPKDNKKRKYVDMTIASSSDTREGCLMTKSVRIYMQDSSAEVKNFEINCLFLSFWIYTGSILDPMFTKRYELCTQKNGKSIRLDEKYHFVKWDLDRPITPWNVVMVKMTEVELYYKKYCGMKEDMMQVDSYMAVCSQLQLIHASYEEVRGDGETVHYRLKRTLVRQPNHSRTPTTLKQQYTYTQPTPDSVLQKYKPLPSILPPLLRKKLKYDQPATQDQPRDVFCSI